LLINLCNTAPVSKTNQIVCIHDANVFAAASSYGLTFRTLYRALLPLIAKRSLRVATVSEFSARQLARHLPIAAEDIAILPNGHEHALSWDPGCASLPVETVKRLADRPYVLVLGSRAPHKNLVLLTGLAPTLDTMGLGLVVAGGGDRIFSAEQIAHAPNVLLLGRVTDDDLALLLDGALCLAFPSLTEGFGLPVVEAMSRGCPVIASDRASLPEICGDAALLADPLAPEAWIAQVRSLLGSADRRDDLIGRGRDRVRRFTWVATAAGYLDLATRRSRGRTISARAPGATPLTAAVVIATRDRPTILAATVRHLLATQRVKPIACIVACVEASDVGDPAALPPGVGLVYAPPGLTRQRNAALSALPAETEIVVFFDDDFIADPDWIGAVLTAFRDEPDVVAVTGSLIADDIHGPGIDFDEAVRMVATAPPAPVPRWREGVSPYGCNMAFRRSAIGDLRFDERLVLYGWLEDRDFAAAVARRGGRLVACGEARGVHMGVKSGRVADERLGYSQIVNPIYMLRKRTMTLRQVVSHVSRNITANVVRSLRPEAYVDRIGRLRGNAMGLTDLVRGRLAPERAAEIQPRPR